MNFTIAFLNRSMDRGILLIATGEEYIQEAVMSARYIKSNYSYNIALVTDEDLNDSIFDKVIIDDNPKYDYRDKPRNLLKSPFSQTLFIDTDVYPISEVQGLFDLLEETELAVAIDSNEYTLRYHDEKYFQGIPEAYPEYNTGVLLYTQSEPMKKFVNSWIENMDPSQINDQPAFRASLYRSSMNHTTLSTKFNCIIGWPAQTVGEVCLIHDVRGNIKSVEIISYISNKLNKNETSRLVYSKGDYIVSPSSPILYEISKAVSYSGNLLFYLDRAIYKIRSEGIIRTIKEIGKRTFSQL